MSQEVLVEVTDLSKKFCKDLKKSLWYGVKDVLGGAFGQEPGVELRKDEFWALKDINFTLRRGECLGLIGHNGAGKSTLLKILNGLLNPDTGIVTIRGKVGALIELGAGFNPILSGRENIYNNAAILGFSKKEIKAKEQEIIDFAEIREFIDMPVKNYSSGMRVRLGFAIAAQMEPDVLIIDEVLAVGDLGFVLKCFKQIDTILPKTAIVFVSHSMPMVSRMCNQIILMENGASKFQGNDVAKGIDLYYNRFVNNESNVVFDDCSIKVEEVVVISDIKVANISQIAWGDNLKIYFKFTLIKPIEIPEIFFILVDKEQRPIALFENNIASSQIFQNKSSFAFYLVHENLQVSKGIYSLNVALRSRTNKVPILRINSIISFQVTHKDEIWEPFLLKSKFENAN